MKIWPLWAYGLTIVLLTATFLYGPLALQTMFRNIIEIQESMK